MLNITLLIGRPNTCTANFNEIFGSRKLKGMIRFVSKIEEEVIFKHMEYNN